MKFQYSLKNEDVRERLTNKLRTTTNFKRFRISNIRSIFINIPLGAAFTYFVISENLAYVLLGGILFWLFFPALGAYSLRRTVNRISGDMLKSSPSKGEVQIEIQIDENRIQFKTLGASLEFDTSFKVLFNESPKYYELQVYRKGSASPCELLSIEKSVVSADELINLKAILSQSFSGDKGEPKSTTATILNM